jgi:hypothetical protein
LGRSLTPRRKKTSPVVGGGDQAYLKDNTFGLMNLRSLLLSGTQVTAEDVKASSTFWQPKLKPVSLKEKIHAIRRRIL